MIANKFFSFDVLIDVAMTKLFMLAEKVCYVTSFACGGELLYRETSHSVDQQTQFVDSTPSKEIMPTIRFSNEDKMVEGNLFESV